MPDAKADSAAWRAAAAAPRIAAAQDLDVCVRVLTAAFLDDPVHVWYLRDDRREAALRRQFHGILEHWVLPLRTTWLAADGGACAMFLPPDPAPERRGLRGWLSLLRAIQPNTGWARLPRAIRLIGAMDAHHPPAPLHYYLWYLGVDPARQGHGIGESLMRAVLAHYDAAGVPTYLENSKPRNTRFYERLGYVGEPAFTPWFGGPAMIPMWRKRT
jgi:ribosomal protein S18 acetylase RimI-like enzyme